MQRKSDEPSRLEIQARMGRSGGHPGKIEKASNPRKALVRLALYLSPFKFAIGLVLIFVLIYTLLGIWEPILIGQTIDRFISARQSAGLVRQVGLLLLIYMFDNIFQAISSLAMARVSQNALRQLRRNLFEHLQTLAIRFFDQHTAGELMSRLTNDIDAINQAVSQNVVSLVASVVSMAGILIAMFILNPWLALASFIVVPIMFWFTNFIAKYTRKGYRELQKQLGNLNGVMEETISGERVVQAFGRSESAVEAFRLHNENVYHAAIYANSYALLLMPLTNVLGNFFVIVLVGLGGWLALQDLVTVGMIATFITYGHNFIQPLRQIANIYNSIQAALAGAERVFEVLDTPSEADEAANAEPTGEFKGDVKFEDVCFGYEPGSPVICDMTLEAKAGQTIALVGPTGAGKTTIISLLMRFYELDGGRITIDRRDLREIPKFELRERLGLVLQDTFLFADTVMENIRFGRLDATDEECIEAARLADADHFINLLPKGYQTRLSERASNLSQGQRQLLSITRAILADPDILILDEATSSVDTRTEARIQRSLLRLMKGRTSFVIAHRLSTIRDADHVVVINNGRVVEQGKHQELLDARGFYYQLYMSQYKGIPL